MAPTILYVRTARIVSSVNSDQAAATAPTILYVLTARFVLKENSARAAAAEPSIRSARNARLVLHHNSGNLAALGAMTEFVGRAQHAWSTSRRPAVAMETGTRFARTAQFVEKRNSE